MNIALTGSGIISAIGLNKAEVLRSLQEKRTGIESMRILDTVHKELPVGEVALTNKEMKARLGIAADQEVSRTALMGMLALKQALKDAKIDLGQADNKKSETSDTRPLRIILVSGTTVGGMDITERHFERMRQGEDTELLQQHDCGSTTQIMADHFGIFDDVATISTACSSAANAMVLGANLLKANEADIVVAGGTEALSRFHLNGFRSLMILDSEPCHPFDAARAGLNLGEGAAFVVMESEAQARRRGATIQAFLTGYGNRCDAYHQTASSANGEGATLAMQDALAMAGLTPNDIQYVNAHGTGTPDNDRSESTALRRIFGENLPPISSTKGFTGHTTSASGCIEAIICLLALREGFIPANLGWRSPMPDGITPSMGIEHANLSHVLCNSFGFGGNDTSLVFSKTSDNTDVSELTKFPEISELARIELTDASDLSSIRLYVKPMAARRMGKLQKAAMLSSLQALEAAGISQPDAIITGTRYGCLENSERMLLDMEASGETANCPTLFMQSTHNTIGSTLAIKLGCHGYNMTYTQGLDSLRWAMRDARLLLQSGRCKTVLVGCHDESTPLFREMMAHATGEHLPEISSVAIVMSVRKDA